MPSDYSGGGPYYQDYSQHETSYGGYVNYGHHASDGGIIVNQYFGLSNPLGTQTYHNHHERSLKPSKRRLTMSGASTDSSRSKRQRIGDFVKITLDIAKESADFGIPLKAALAGLSTLLEHYEEFKGVKDKIVGLLPQLNRLGHTTTTIDGGPEDTRRHAELISAFEEIERGSQELLAKNQGTQFVDKSRNSEEVARLVEQFREAISHYHKSQQREIYNRITYLTLSFNTLLELQEKSPAVKNKLDSAMARLDGLCTAEGSNDDGEYERWAKLFNTLRLIMDNGNVLYNRLNSQGYEGYEEDIQTVSGIAEYVRDAILDYQISKQHAIYHHDCKLIDPMDLAVLNSCRRARGAEYKHGNRRGCLRGTRETVLDEIESWTKDFDKSPVFWLNGLAGTGKSTIAQTIAEHALADGLLGASFFCSRDFDDLSNLHFIFPTLAFQLAQKFPSFRAHLVPILRSNPDVVHESLFSQMEKLIVEPLRWAEIPTVIVVDALDECKDDEPSSAILSVLGRLVEQIPRVKFFITGRPEPRIKTGFRLPLLKDATNVFVLHDVHPDLINNDILLFLKHELSKLSQRHGLGGWPSDENISLLCQRSAGLFVYAVATVKFLDSSKTLLPEQRLDVILNLPESTSPEGKTLFKPETTLDSLYLSVLQMAFGEEDPEVYPTIQSVIGTVVLLINPLPPSGIAELANLNSRQVMLLLTSVQSLLILDEDPTQPVKSFHKSFPDFITDPCRCIDSRFYISPEKFHLQLAISCLTVMNDMLEQNLLDLPNYTLNSDVIDLQTRVDTRISVVLRYACQSWYNHLTLSDGNFTDVVSRLRFFLEEKFLAWLEVLSALKATRVAVVALEKLMSWLQEVSNGGQLLDTAKDCFYFVTEFFEPINASAAHIYQSALELTPLSSIVRKLHYHRRLTLFPKLKIGIPDLRDPTTAIPCKYGSSVWSPCGKFIAIQTEDVVEIRDALTSELVSTLQNPRRDTTYSLDVPSYSPDGHSLACSHSNGIIIWDIQTGGVAKMIQSELSSGRLLWSPDGRVVGVLTNRSINIYDITSNSELSSIKLKSGGYLWAHNETFRVMTMDEDNKTFEIFEVGPALTKIESFPIQLDVNTSLQWSFSETTYRIALHVKKANQLVILDIRTLGRLLVVELEYSPFSSLTFSSDGRHFGAVRQAQIHIWSCDAGDYTLWRMFHFSITGIQGLYGFSPKSSSILVGYRNVLRILHLDSPPIAPNVTRNPQLDIFSRSGTLIATAHYQKKTITITNCLSQTAVSQFIDTGTYIMGLGLIGNVLLVHCFGKVIAWLLTEGAFVNVDNLNRRAGLDDSIWTLSMSTRFRLKLSVVGEIGAIKYGTTLHVYNSITGEVLDSDQELPTFSGPWYYFEDNLHVQDDRHNGPMQGPPPKYKWKRSDTTWSWKDGWLKDSQGQCLLWLPGEWRVDWRSNVEWFPDISTIKFKSHDGKPIIIELH